MNDDIRDHEGDPLGIFSVMSDIGFQGFLVQLWIQFSPTSRALDTWRFLEKGVIGVRHEKTIVACISIDQNKAHRQIELEAFIVIDVSHEIEGLVNFIEPPVMFQGKGEWEIEIGTRWTEAMVAKNELGIVTQQGVQLLVFKIEMRCYGSISLGIIHMVESVMKQFFSANKGVQTDTTMEPPVAFSLFEFVSEGVGGGFSFLVGFFMLSQLIQVDKLLLTRTTCGYRA